MNSCFRHMEFESAASWVEYDLPRPVIAYAIYLEVATWHTAIILDAELFGCEYTEERESASINTTSASGFVRFITCHSAFRRLCLQRRLLQLRR